MSCYGTKAANDSSHDWRPDTLKELYDEIRERLGQEPFKPRPGEEYRKCFKPKTEMDGPSFKQLPSDIIITSPPRLFRTYAWRYKGNFYMEADYCWEVQYKYARFDKGQAADRGGYACCECTCDFHVLNQLKGRNFAPCGAAYCEIEKLDDYTGFLRYSHGWNYSWMPLFVLSNAYIHSTITFNKPRPKPITQQLELFTL